MPSSNKINTVAVFFITALAFIAASAIYQRLRSRRIAGGRRCCSDSNEKPQNRFKRVLADNSYSPFKHYKHDGKEKEISLKVHPYEEEIASLLERPPNQVEFIISHESLTMDHSYVWIHTKDQLEFLARLLGEEHAFAVDTEQHSLRSFLGFTALMQISTQKEDFLLDTIALHDAMDILRPVFADPSICKVFHGADNDVLWLQRDFHIYVVNMFDTAKACEVLSKPQKSLAYLLETYCGVSTDKTFQREDWRLRPLSAEMIQYARTDAHYLLYIADCLASELRKDNSACFDEKFNLLFEATRRSNMVCMQLYAKETDSSPGASAAASLYSRNLHVQEFTPSKISEIKEHLWKLCAWRDLMIVKTYFGGREITAEDLEMALLVGMSPHEIRRLEKKKGLRLKRNNENSFQIPAQTNEYDINLSSDVHNSKELSEDGDANDIDNEQEVLSFKSAKKLSLLGHGPHGKQVVEHLLSNYEEDGVSQFCQKWRQVFVEAVRPRFLPPGWDIMHSGRREFGDYSVYNPAKRAIEMTIN